MTRQEFKERVNAVIGCISGDERPASAWWDRLGSLVETQFNLAYDDEKRADAARAATVASK